MDKELAGKLQSMARCPSDSDGWKSQELLLGLVMFDSFVTNREMCGAGNMLERRDGIQRDMENLERWGYVNLMMFNKFKCTVLHKSIPSTNTGWSENVEIMLQIIFC